MRVSLNLLPEEKKEIVRRKRFDRVLFRQAFLLFSVVVFHLVVLGSVFFILHDNRLLVEDNGLQYAANQTEFKDLTLYESKFSQANAIADQANAFQRSRPDWAGFLLRIDRLVPPHIALSSLATKEYRCFVSGTAETRDDFLLLEDALKKDDCLFDFQIPVSNLFLEKNVDFQVDFTVKESCLMGTKAL